MTGRVLGDVDALRSFGKRGVGRGESISTQGVAVRTALELFNATTEPMFRVFSEAPANLIALGKVIAATDEHASIAGDAFSNADRDAGSSGNADGEKFLPDISPLSTAAGKPVGFELSKSKDGSNTEVLRKKNKDGSITETTFAVDKDGKVTTKVVAKRRIERDGSITVEVYDKSWFAGKRKDTAGDFTAFGKKVDYEAYVSAGAAASATVTGGINDGTLQGEAKVTASVAIQGSVTASTNIKGVDLTSTTTVTAGATGEVGVKASVGKNGVEVEAGGEVFVGVKATTEVKASAGGVTGTLGGGVTAGIGAHAKTKVDATMKKIGVKVDIGASVGLGAEVNFDVSINPSKVITTVKGIDLWPF
jgi:hypothetical protein